MSKVNLSDLDKEAQKEGLIGSGVFKIQEGPNRIRLVAGPLKHAEDYQGQARLKWLWYVIDRRDGTVKPYFMPHSLFKMVRDLQTNDDYAFEEVPLPFDITISAKGAGTREVEYGLVPSPKHTPLSAEEQAALADQKPIEDYQRQVREKRGEPDGKRFDPDEVPI